MKTYKAELFDNRRHELAESPCFDERSGVTSYVDITRGLIFRINGSSRTEFSLGEQVGACVPCEDGSYILCGTKALYGFDGHEAKKVFPLDHVFEPWQRCNDCKADPSGRLFIGSSSYKDGFEGGNLYLWDKELRVLEADTGIANGMAWNGDKFYFADSREHAVFVYRYSPDGSISDRKVLFKTDSGVPDGLCIDGNGDLWVAIWGGSRIEHRDGVTGQLRSVIELPATNVTSCCFISDNTLFITTSGLDLDGEYDGCLFTCKVDSIQAPSYLASRHFLIH